MEKIVNSSHQQKKVQYYRCECRSLLTRARRSIPTIKIRHKTQPPLGPLGYEHMSLFLFRVVFSLVGRALARWVLVPARLRLYFYVFGAKTKTAWFLLTAVMLGVDSELPLVCCVSAVLGAGAERGRRNVERHLPRAWAMPVAPVLESCGRSSLRCSGKLTSPTRLAAETHNKTTPRR